VGSLSARKPELRHARSCYDYLAGERDGIDGRRGRCGRCVGVALIGGSAATISMACPVRLFFKESWRNAAAVREPKIPLVRFSANGAGKREARFSR
jgi:hypothetical protein